MDFAFTEDEERFRAELRAFLADELPAWWRGMFVDDPRVFPETRRICAKLAERGWLTMAWPREYGGQEASAWKQAVLFEHPAVRSVAIVPMPDAKLGERVCAFVVPSDPAAPPALADLVRFLEAREISRRKLPERLEVVDELPATASGKVQKHVLRERIARRLAAEGGSA
jgi:hypothetical protein